MRAWRTAFDELENGATDIAIVACDHIPARFHHRTLFEEDFVIAMRASDDALANKNVRGLLRAPTPISCSRWR
jgi:DNA-binding transcriptional LysR family regulator